MTIKEIMEMNREAVESRMSELDKEVEKLSAEEATEDAVTKIRAYAEERKLLTDRKKELEAIEQRQRDASALTSGAAAGKVIAGGDGGHKEPSLIEKRANEFAKTGRMELRQLLSTGVLTPTAVKQEIGELPTVVSSIVDDVNAFDATGCGAWSFAYRKTDSVAAKVTEGQQISGTAGTFETGTISPSVWGILDEISNQVKKFTPLAYEQSVRNNAYLALRRYAKAEIVKAILASDLVDKEDKLAIDENFLRTLVLGFNCDEGVAGGAKLYLTKATLQKIGKVRGASEKKALYEITFTDDNNGTIKEGGLTVNFSICSDLGQEGIIESGAEDVMIYGQMKAVDMPLWDRYTVETDEGGDYFKRNMMGIRGLQTAGVGVTRPHTVKVINNKTNP